MSKYRTQTGTEIEDKKSLAFNQYQESVLKNIPAEKLMTLYKDIADIEYGPLEDWQIVSPLANYTEEVFGTMSALDYIDDLGDKNKLVLSQGKNLKTNTGNIAGETAVFRPDLNPSLYDGPDTLFVREWGGVNTPYKWDTELEELDTILHELGHTHDIKGVNTPAPVIEKGGRDNLLIHSENVSDGHHSHDTWDHKMEEFLENYVK